MCMLDESRKEGGGNVAAEPFLKTTIGKITYLVRVYFNNDSRDSMADKIERLILRDLKNAIGK